MSSKHKHLDLISDVISRMGQNSFQIKGWAVIVVAAILGIALDRSKQSSALFGLAPLAAFWLLDSYYLRIERSYRSLYDLVRVKSEDEINFDMLPPTLDGPAGGYLPAVFSRTLILTYGGLALVILIVSMLI